MEQPGMKLGLAGTGQLLDVTCVPGVLAVQLAARWSSGSLAEWFDIIIHHQATTSTRPLT